MSEWTPATAALTPMGDRSHVLHRAYIRHPSDIPIVISSAVGGAQEKRALNNVSFGGLSCGSGVYLQPGTLVSLRVPLIKPPFEAQGRVVWCRARADGYDLGIEFLHADDAFRVRMVEQICHIEQYRRQVRIVEGRQLTGEQAAREWISLFAADFPDPGPREPDAKNDD